jgi:hypothetical protein
MAIAESVLDVQTRSVLKNPVSERIVESRTVSVFLLGAAHADSR